MRDTTTVAADPNPGSADPVRGPRRGRWTMAVLAVAVLLGAGSWSSGVVPCDVLHDQPACNVAMLPGPAERIDDLLEVDAPQTWGSGGELVLTTIVVDSNLNVVEYLRDTLDPDAEVVDREAIYPPGRSVEDARIENEILMSDSQLTSKVAAMHHLGVDLSGLTAGGEVMAVLPDTPAEAAGLRAGDVIVAVDDQQVEDADAAVAAIGTREPGDEVTLTLQGHDADDGDVTEDDDSGTQAVPVTLDANPEEGDRPYVGVLLRDFQVLPYDIDIEAGAIGGPSAGLMFSVAIVDRLTAEDLTGGRIVAGTGTIDTQGQVGPIGGIAQKIVGASTRDDPAEVFLVPAGNWETAQTARPHAEMTLVRVATLDEAVAALEDLASDRLPDNAVATGPTGPSAPTVPPAS